MHTRNCAHSHLCLCTCIHAHAQTWAYSRGHWLTPICTCTLTLIQYTHRRAHTLKPICVHTLYAHMHIHTAQFVCTGTQGSVHMPEHRAEWPEVMEKLPVSQEDGGQPGAGRVVPGAGVGLSSKMHRGRTARSFLLGPPPGLAPHPPAPMFHPYPTPAAPTFPGSCNQ